VCNEEWKTLPAGILDWTLVFNLIVLTYSGWALLASPLIKDHIVIADEKQRTDDKGKDDDNKESPIGNYWPSLL